VNPACIALRVYCEEHGLGFQFCLNIVVIMGFHRLLQPVNQMCEHLRLICY
jgi:hypothetical protein